jgi:hypothetical protein
MLRMWMPRSLPSKQNAATRHVHEYRQVNPAHWLHTAPYSSEVMMRSSWTSHARHPHSQIIACAIVSTLAVGACADPLGVPAPGESRAVPAAAALTRGPAIPLVSNGQRYRVRDPNAGTGRSGNAQVTARAMVGQDGTTVLDVTTGGLDAAFAPRGSLAKTQVKLLDPDNVDHALSTVNYVGLTGGNFTTTYDGLAAGLPLQIQANVKGVDGNRTDVVTITERVKRRPDIAVTLGTLEAARVHVPAEISATVRELNGDLGATGDCILLVNGVAVDRATGIWVDAGDAVSCAFLHTFATSGSHAVAVRVDGVVPGDWDTANNEARGTISVVDPVVEPSYWAIFAYQAEFTYESQVNGYARSLLAPTTPGYWEQAWGSANSTRVQERVIGLEGWGAQFVSFPLDSFRASFWSDGQLLQTASLAGPIEPTEAYAYADPAFAYRQACVFRMDDATAIDGGAAGRMYVQLCSYEMTSDGGSTWTRESSVYVRQYAGSVTYWSAGFSEARFRAADGTMACYPESCYSYNEAETVTTGAPPFTLGNEVRGSFDVIGANGVHLALDRSALLSPFLQEFDQPYQCNDYVDPNFEYLSHFCNAYSNTARGKSGSTYSY